MEPDNSFWHEISQLIKENQIIIDRPKHSAHPRYPGILYPLDYGYLENTIASDGGGVDVWLGSLETKTLTGILCTFDTIKRDMEIKLLIACADDDIQIIQTFHGEMYNLYIPNPENQ
jgi:inorganic pyrophosphatase